MASLQALELYLKHCLDRVLIFCVSWRNAFVNYFTFQGFCDWNPKFLWYFLWVVAFTVSCKLEILSKQDSYVKKFLKINKIAKPILRKVSKCLHMPFSLDCSRT